MLIFAVFILLTFFFFIPANSQIITYGTGIKEEKDFIPSTYAIGQQDDNIMIWHYDLRNKNLKLYICDKGMVLQNKISIPTKQVDHFSDLTFFQQNDHNSVLMHYIAHNKKVLQLYTYQPEMGTVLSQKIVDASSSNTQTIVKYSSDGQYTGLMQAYNATYESTLIRYFTYNSVCNPVSDIKFILPFKYDAIDLSSALIDKDANLIFYTNLSSEKASEQAITLYKVDVKKDSLFVSSFFKNSTCINVQLQQNTNSENITVSGILMSDSNTAAEDKSQAYSSTHFFIMQVTKDLNLKGQVSLIPIDKIIGDSPTTSTRINSINLIPNKDSSYSVYASGLTGYNVKYFESNTGREFISPKNVRVYYNYTMNKGLQIAPNVYFYDEGSPVVLSSFYKNTNSPVTPSYMKFITASASGTNFFSVLSLTPSRTVTTVNMLQYKEMGSSFPEFEFTTNTSGQIDYIFSRGLKGNKQSVSDITFKGNGALKIQPVLINPAYTLYLAYAQKVSPHFVIVPFSKKNGLSFARIDLK